MVSAETTINRQPEVVHLPERTPDDSYLRLYLDEERANTFIESLTRLSAAQATKTMFAVAIDGIPTEEYTRRCTSGTREDLIRRTEAAQAALVVANDFCKLSSLNAMYIDAKVSCLH